MTESTTGATPAAQPPAPTTIPLTPEQIARVDAAIAEAEKLTSGEIVAVVAARSSIYWHAPFQAGIWGAGIALALATIVSLVAGWGWPLWYVHTYVLISFAGFVAGFFVARIESVEYLFADEPVMRAECEERAARIFTEHAVFATAGRTGVLVYVSLFERMVIVIGDTAISEKLGPTEYQAVVGAMIARIRVGNLEQGLTEGIRMLGGELARHFPASAADVNELPDKLLLVP